MKEMSSQRVRNDAANVWPLYGAAFAMAMGLNVLWTVMPFVIRNIGGTEEHVGYAWAANMLGYMVCLLFTAAMLDHLNTRRATRTATAAMFLATIAMLIAVRYAIVHDQFGSPLLIWMVIAAGTLAGGAMSLFWPFLMAWVSADYEGVLLNRRLGTYNGMWSGAVILGPLIGGALVDMSTLGPIVTSAMCLATCFVLLSLARHADGGQAHDESAGTVASVPASSCQDKNGGVTRICFDSATLSRLKWMARIAMFCSWTCSGVARSQFALLFTGMGFSETQFGILITIFGIFNFLTLTGAGRVDFWHFRPALLFGVQAVLALTLLLIIFGRTLWAFVPAFMIMGVGFGFAYSSHLYYASCGSKKRSAPMAIHEVTLSLGIVVGSGAGGYLAANVGPYSPYWFAAGILVLGAIAQSLTWAILKPRRQSQEVG
jgi:MFS family permease